MAIGWKFTQDKLYQTLSDLGLWRGNGNGRNGKGGNGNGNGRHGDSPSFRRVLLVNPLMITIGAEFMMQDMPLRLEYLAGYIREHVDAVDMVDMNMTKRPLSYYLRRFQPDLVGISANYISTHQTTKDAAAEARRHGAKVIVGGYQVTALADEFAADPNIDWVARGEGEATLLDVINKKPNAEILGISYQGPDGVIHNPERPPIADLDSIPLPDRTLRKAEYKSPFMDLEAGSETGFDIIISSRGCWGRCKFCTEPMMSHGKQRYRGTESFLAELDQIVATHRHRDRIRISLTDPNFGGDIKRAEELCDAIIEYRKTCPIELNFFISVRTITIANNEVLTRKMVEAGMDYVFVGMESPNKKDLKAIQKGSGSREKQEKAARMLQEAGAGVMSCFLLGLPGQTEEDIFALVDYARSLKLTDAYFSIMMPLPGSKLYDEAAANGDLLETDFTKFRLWDMLTKHDVLSRAKITELCIRSNAKWWNDLLLGQEVERWEKSGRQRKKLRVYARKFTALVGFMTHVGNSGTGELDNIDPATFVMEMPNAQLRELTERVGLHNLLDLDRFLAILGSQKVMVSLKLSDDDAEAVTWVLKTSDGKVDYLDAIRGTVDDASVAINIPLHQGLQSARGIVARILRDNASAKARINLLRLLAALSSEVLVGVTERAVENLRQEMTAALVASPLARLAANGKTAPRAAQSNC